VVAALHPEPTRRKITIYGRIIRSLVVVSDGGDGRGFGGEHSRIVAPTSWPTCCRAMMGLETRRSGGATSVSLASVMGPAVCHDLGTTGSG